MKRLLIDEDGPVTVEYAVLLALIILVVIPISIPVLVILGTQILDMFENVSNVLPH